MSDNRLIRGRPEELRNLKPGEVAEVSKEELKQINRDAAVNFRISEEFLDRGNTILDEAKAAVLGSRHDDYGHCYTLYSKMAELMNALFSDRLPPHGQFAVTDMPMILILLKLCREQHKAKRDNRVDIAGYAEVLDEIQQDIDRMFGGKDVVPDKR